MSNYIANKYYSESYSKDNAIIEDPVEPKINYTKIYSLWSNKYFQFHILASGQIFLIKREDADPITISYRINHGTWYPISSGTDEKIEVVVGDIVEFKGDNRVYNTCGVEVTFPGNGYDSNISNSENVRDFISFSNSFGCSKGCRFNIAGNIKTLTSNMSPKDFGFYGLFYECPGVVSAENMIIDSNGAAAYGKMFMNCPNIKIGPYIGVWSHFFIFTEMFRNCPKLETIPYMSVRHSPITSNVDSSTRVYPYYDLHRMFMDCVKLKNIKVENYTSQNYFSCYEMFRNCQSLEESPFEYVGAWSGRYGCGSMFYDCINLKKAPKIYGENCYISASIKGVYTHSKMFYNCSSLEEVIIQSTGTYETWSHCFDSMFYGCSSLKKVLCGASITSYDTTSDMFTGANSTGIFVGHIIGNYLPSGWTYIDTNGQSFIDLGLPSGTLWSQRIIRCAWGETAEKESYTLDNYNLPAKYTSQSTLDAEEDPIIVNLGGAWTMPTDEQIEELRRHTIVNVYHRRCELHSEKTSKDYITFGDFPRDGQTELNEHGVRMWTKTKNRALFLPAYYNYNYSYNNGETTYTYYGEYTEPTEIRYNPGYQALICIGVITIPSIQ